MQVQTQCGHAPYVKATQDWRDIWHIRVRMNESYPIMTYVNIPITGLCKNVYAAYICR